MPLAAGTRFGPYEILAPIGAGGMGEVYRARDTRLDRVVAIKVLPEHLSSKPQLRERFEREARAVSSLNHPHICTLHDVGHQDGIDFLVMEYLEGETLAQRLNKGPLPLDQLLTYSIEVAAALDQAHRHGVIHRDLKPGNIVLTKTGAKVLDFGLAKIGAGLGPVPAATMTLTEEGAILGTLQYMAPEQLEGKDADARSDIFAFGAVVYEMATGQKAFEGKSRASVMAAILERQPPPISSLQALTPPALDHVVRTCLAKDPDARRQTAHDVMLELKWIAEGSSQAGVPAPVIGHRRNRERLAWALTSIAVAAAIVLGFILFRRPPSEVHAARFILQAPEGAVLADEQDTGGPAISPDGRLLALVATRATSTAEPLLWVRALDSVTAQPLSGTEDASFPFWSPDSRFIGFFAQGKLKKIDAAGRSAQTICNAPDGFGTSAWNQEGVILFSPAFNAPLNRVPAAGGAPTPALALDTSRKEFGQRWIQFLPDGRHFLYTAFVSNAHSDDNALYVASLDSEKPSGSKDRKRLFSTDYKAAYAPPPHGGTGHLLFWRGNSLMAQPFDPQKLELAGEPVPAADQGGEPDNGGWRRPFSVSENGVLVYPSNLPSFENRQMVWYDRAGKRVGTVGEPGVYFDPRLSPDQKQIAVSRVSTDLQSSAIWLFDLTRNTTSRFTFHAGFKGRPIWSPDGSRIVFNSDWEGTHDLYQKAASGAGSEEQILKGSPSARPSDWSRNGQFIVYEVWDSKPDLRPGTWVLPLEGDRKPFLFEQTESFAWQAVFSPDGRWLAYASDESRKGKFEVYVRAFTGRPGAAVSGGKWLLSTSGGYKPRWRRDGKEVFYLADGVKLMAAEVKNGANFEAGAPKLLFDMHAKDVDYDVTADGQRFIVATPVEGAQVRSPITVVLNWQAGLKK